MPVAKSKPFKKVSRRTATRRAAQEISPTEIKLSARDSKRVLADLATPPPPNEALKQAAVRYKRRVAADDGECEVIA